MSKLPRTTMSLKQFLIRQEVLSLYKNIFRALRQVKDEKTRFELKQWAQGDFRKHMHETDEFAIKSLLKHGQKSLKDLQSNLAMSESASQ